MKPTFEAPPPAASPGPSFAAEALLDALPWGVLALDAAGIIRCMNQQAARWCGLPAAALLGQSLAALPPALGTAVSQLLEPGAAAPCEVLLPGQERWISLSATPQPDGWVLCGHDLAARKQQAPQQQAPAVAPLDQLTQRTNRYHALFDTMDQGFCVLEVLFDEAGRQAVDFRYLELNPVFARQSGMPAEALGKTARDFVPDLEPFWFDTYGHVARTGETVRVEHYVPQVGRWFDVHAFRVDAPEARQVAVLFNDITGRKRREQNLAFLADLNVDFAPLLSTGQIMARVSEHLADYLHLSRCHLAEVNATADSLEVTFDWQRPPGQLPPLLGPHRIADYLTPAGRQHFEAGRPLVLSGLETSLLVNTPLEKLVAMGFGSSVDIPLLIDGRWRFLLTAARAAPGPWQPDEVALLQQLATRIHARLARAQAETALKEAHEQLVSVLERTNDAFYGLDADFRFSYVNHRAAQLWGREPAALIGQVYWEAFPQMVGSTVFCQHEKVRRSQQSAHFETLSPVLNIWIEVSIYPGRQGGLSVFFRDITARKQAEERQAFLLRLGDVLRPLAQPADVQRTAAQLLGEQLQTDWCGYAEVHADNGHATVHHDYHAPDNASLAGTYRLRDFGPDVLAAMQRGETLAIDDVTAASGATADPATAATFTGNGMQAFVAVPLVKSDRLTAMLFVHHRQPRGWLPAEVALIQETAERTWAAVERSNAEAARHASEQRLRAVMENLPGTAVFIVDRALRYQLAEGAALRLAGYAPADFVGQPVQALAPSALWSDYQQHYEHALAGQAFEYEHEQNGRTFSTQGGPLRAADGTVTAVLAVSYDITARQRAEAAVQESEEKYRTLFDSIDEGYCIIEMLFNGAGQPHDWRFVEVNPAFEKNNGLANATGKTIRELVPDIEPKWFATYGRVAQTGEPLRFEEESGALGRWFSLYAFAVGAPGSSLVAVLFTDITARREVEEALRLSEARLSLALQAGRMGSFEWTSDGNRIRLSAMSGEVLGLRPGTTLATSDEGLALLVHPDDRARHQALFDHAGRTGEDFHSVFRIVRPIDGEVRWIEERGQGAHEPASSGVCLRGLHWDVTETMLAQQRLAGFNAKLERRVVRRTRELQASRDLLQSVFDTSPLGMSVQEAVRDDTGAVQDFRLRLVSRELARETGRTDLVGKLYAQEYPGIREAGIFDLAVRTVETGEPHGMEYYYPHEGFDKWFACQFVKLGDGIVATNLDITERKTAEQERLKNLRLLEQAEAVAGLGSWDYDLTTSTLRWSDGMYQLFGLPVGSPVAPADYLGRVMPDDRARAEQLVQRLASGSGDFEETLRLRVDGQVKTVHMKAVVLRDAQQQAVRVLGIDLDISKLHHLEQENLRLRLRQQRALFEAVQTAQEAERKRMAENLHNGIGQILYATKLHLDRLHLPLLGTDPTLLAARREADQLLGEAIRQTRALSHELVPMVLAEFGLAAALHDVARNMSIPPLRFHCQVQFDDEAAPLGPALQMAVYRMAQELAQNIAKHARGATSATLELETMPGWVLLRAEDNGPGFSPTPTEQPGLGLRSIRDRVALLGGQVEFGSVPTGGAYVRIRIPLPASPTLPLSPPL